MVLYILQHIIITILIILNIREKIMINDGDGNDVPDNYTVN